METGKTLEILDRLVAFDTVSAQSNLAIIDYIQAFLSARGFAVHRVPSPDGTKAGLFARLGPPGRGVLLSGHTDVVPVVGQDWSSDPFRLSRAGGRLYGRGTTDMKGYLASMLALADCAAQANLKEPLKLAFSYDEEVGCVGIQQMIGQLSQTIGLPRACLVGEPTEMQVVIGHKGKAALRAVFSGEAGHSAMAPKFTNALHLAGEFMAEIRDVQAGLARQGAQDAAYDIPYTTLHIGKLSGGTALNIVPDRAEMTFEYRHIAHDAPDQIMAQITEAAARVAARHGSAAIEIDRYNSYPGLDVAEDSEIVSLAQNLSASSGTTKVAFGTEAGVFAQHGIPTVVCGPGSMSGQGHKTNEYLSEKQLANCDAMMGRLLALLSGVDTAKLGAS